ncbi:MAG: PD-(D/E)XK nuclease family protein [Symploca sp. SIO2B6]|nr:PD-(D/E)XK nuclease family protein [Symploca sp. SIO2B6]
MAVLQLSQTHLTVLEQCPRKFQYIYINQLMTPVPSEQRMAMERGSQIHHLIHQHELQLPLESWIPSANSASLEHPPYTAASRVAELYAAAASLSSAIPITDETTLFRQSEYRLNVEMSGVLLTVVYDLLLLKDTQAYIFDWKTYAQPPRRETLAHTWQTQLYPFVLVETSDYSPNQVHLSYWFIHNDSRQSPSTDLRSSNHPKSLNNSQPLKPECLSFDYSDRLHQRIRISLQTTIEQVKIWLEEYPESTAFPKTHQMEEHCTTCQFALRCDRLQQAQADWEALLDISMIDEVPLGITTPQETQELPQN